MNDQTVEGLTLEVIALRRERDELKRLLDDLTERVLPGVTDSGDAFIEMVRDARALGAAAADMFTELWSTGILKSPRVEAVIKAAHRWGLKRGDLAMLYDPNVKLTSPPAANWSVNVSDWK